MQYISLPVSVTANAVLNQDNTTLLRSLHLQEGDIYQIDLSFFSGASGYTPTLGEFAFYLREESNPANTIAAVNSLSGNSFFLDLTSPAVTLALGYSKTKDFRASLSFTDGGTLDIIQPFLVKIVNSYAGITGSVPGFVNSINNLSGNVLLTGDASISVSQNGQTISLSVPAPNLSAYALTSALDATGDALNASIIALESQTGDYYLKTNPDGFINSAGLSPYALTSYVDAADTNLQSQVSNSISAINDIDSSISSLNLSVVTLQGQTGDYYQNSNPSGFINSSALTPYALTSSLGSAAFTASSAYDSAGSASTVQSILQAEINTLSGEIIPSGGNYYGNFFGNGAGLTGVSGAGGGFVSGQSATGVFVGTFSGEYFSTTSGASATASWNPAVVSALTVSASSATISLPSVPTNGAFGFIKNVSSVPITLNGGGGTNMIWNKAAVTSLSIQPGNSFLVMAINSLWNVIADNSFPHVIADANLAAQSAAGTVVSVTVPSDGANTTHTLNISPWMDVLSRTTDVIAMQVTYLDEQATSRVLPIYPIGATVSGISTTGPILFPTVSIRSLGAQTVTVATTLPTAGGSISFDAGATITQLN